MLTISINSHLTPALNALTQLPQELHATTQRVAAFVVAHREQLFLAATTIASAIVAPIPFWTGFAMGAAAGFVGGRTLASFDAARNWHLIEAVPYEGAIAQVALLAVTLLGQPLLQLANYAAFYGYREPYAAGMVSGGIAGAFAMSTLSRLLSTQPAARYST